MAAMFVNGSGRNWQSLISTFHICFPPSFGLFDQAVTEEKIFQKSTNLKQELPVVAMFVNGSKGNEQSLQRTFHRCFLPSFISFGQSVAEENLFQKSTNQKQELSMAGMFVNGSQRNQQSLQRTFHRCFLPNFSSFGKAVPEEKIFQKSTNQKQEWPLAAMFDNGSELNEQSLQRTFQGCFLPNFDSFGQAVSEEKIFLEINRSKTRIACGGHVC